MEAFEKLGICEAVLTTIKAKKFTKPSEIQEKAIPLILEGSDIIAGSATGSGKTLAFGAGIIKGTKKGEGIQALVLTPTRELAEQVASSLEEFSYSKELTLAAVYGGVSLDPQVTRLSRAEIVVATPGRLLDHMSRNNIDLSKVRFLVLDEADRMWDMGFKDDVGKIVQACPTARQTMLFSATISHELEDFSKKYMKNPIEVSVENQVDPSKLHQVYYDVRDDEKFSLLVHLLMCEKAHLVMIFCNTRRNADVVNKNLKLQGISSQVIHGGLSQAKRNQVIKQFDSSKVNVLVCTDVAARGLDIQGISHVYNYDLPSDHRDYVHRIGRTARAGKEGIAINILASRDYDNFSGIRRNYPELKIVNKPTPSFDKVFVKMERRDDRRGPSRGPRRDSRGPRRDGRSSPRGRQGDNASRSSGSFSRSRPDHRGRQQRGERNKRSENSSFRRGSRDSSHGPRTGFRGGGRNTRNRSFRR